MSEETEKIYDSMLDKRITDHMKSVMPELLREPMIVIANEIIPPAIKLNVNGKIDDLRATQKEDREKLESHIEKFDKYAADDIEHNKADRAVISQLSDDMGTLKTSVELLVTFQKKAQPIVKLRDDLGGFGIVVKYVVIFVVGAGALVGAILTIIKIFK